MEELKGEEGSHARLAESAPANRLPDENVEPALPRECSGEQPCGVTPGALAEVAPQEAGSDPGVRNRQELRQCGRLEGKDLLLKEPAEPPDERPVKQRRIGEG